MARICPLFSSSSGNSILIGSADRYILIDAGVSAKRLTAALADRDIPVSRIEAIFVTHEHDDHISGISLFAGKNSIPVFATEGTLTGMERKGALKGVDGRVFSDGMECAGMVVSSFATSHDTAQSCGYVVDTADGRRVAVATDTGYIPFSVQQALKTCDAMVIESNHDEKMLRNGPYPPFLKQRILSPCGHLSNDACAAALPDLVRSGATRFILGHLSEKNNLPSLAYSCSKTALDGAGMKDGLDYLLSVAPPQGGEMVVF